MDEDSKGQDGRSRRRTRNRKRGPTCDDALVMRVALAMYQENGVPSHCSARRVAKKLRLPYQQVTACVDKAYESGLCVTLVNLKYEEAQAQALAQRLRDRYSLKQVMLVPGFPAMLRDLKPDERRRVHSAVIRRMTPLAASLLDSIVADAIRTNADCNVSVSWGRTLRMFADQLEQSARRVAWSRLRVLPAVGPTEWAKTDPVEASFNAMRVASVYGGSWGQLPCPAFVRAEHVERWLALDEVREALDRLRDCHCVITSLGPIPGSEDLIDVTLSSDPAMSKALADDARKNGARGEINYWAFGADGQPVNTAYRALGIGFDGLKKLSADPERWVVLLCGGDRYRIDALKGALAARLCNVLVSDTVTARALLQVEEPPEDVVYGLAS